MNAKVWFKIEEFIPDEQAIGARGFWTQLARNGFPFRTDGVETVNGLTRKLLDEGRKVRAVRVTEEVVDVP